MKGIGGGASQDGSKRTGVALRGRCTPRSTDDSGESAGTRAQAVNAPPRPGGSAPLRHGSGPASAARAAPRVRIAYMARMLFVPTPPAAEASARERSGLAATFRRLWPYLWPHGRPDLQRRVMLAFGLLLAAKLVTVLTPFTYKWATDALVAIVEARSGAPGRVEPAAPGHWLWGAPVLLTALYGLSRIAMALLTQVRDGLFAKVSMHAVRR